MYDLKSISKRLKEKRIEKGYKTQKSFAEEININPSTLSAYEKGDKLMTLEHLSIICAQLDCSLDWLIYGDSSSPAKVSFDNKSNGEKIADAIVTLIDNNILTTEEIDFSGFSFASRREETHHAYKIYIADYHHHTAKDFFNAYYTSVKVLSTNDLNRKEIAKSLIKSYKDKLEEENK